MSILAQDAFDRTSTNAWGTADVGGAWTRSSGTSTDFSVGGGEARVDITTINSQRLMSMQSVLAEDADMIVKVKLPVAPTGGSVFVYLLAHYLDFDNHYAGTLIVRTTGEMQLEGRARVAGTYAQFGSTIITSETFTADAWYWLRMQAEGIGPTTLRLKLWKDGNTEPANWHFEQQDSTAALQVGGNIGIRTILSSSNTNTLPYRVSYDDFSMAGIPEDGVSPEIGPSTFPITSGADTLYLRYSSSVTLTGGTQTRAVIVFHGNSRNGPDYLRYAVQAAEAVRSSALIVAPQFVIAEEVESFGLPADTLYWSSSGWKKGDKSRDYPYARVFRYSSFAAIDRLVEHLAANFPNLTDIAMIGHSAGGQFVNRYSAISQVQSAYPGIRFQYIVANPSTYLYMDSSRRTGTSPDTFGALSAGEITAAPTYNDYKYGLDNLNTYGNTVGAAQIQTQFASRNVLYLLGSGDTLTDSSLDKSASAYAQGNHRYERGLVHYNYLGSYYGATVYDAHKIAVVPDIGHDGRSMINSGQARLYLFNVPFHEVSQGVVIA